MAVLRRPELLADHLANYVELLKAEGRSLGLSLAVRMTGAAVALVALLLALGLTGVAILIGAMQGVFSWWLVAVPGCAWLLFMVGAVLAMRSPTREMSHDIKNEVTADFRALQLVKEVQDD